MYNALVIGCGNIGAQYDWDSDAIHTHAKAFYLNPNFRLTVFDINQELSQSVSKKYSCSISKSIDKETLGAYECISICTPTDTHFGILNDAIEMNVKLIICEKPVSDNKDDLQKALSIYNNGNSKVLVNYVRRFQPVYSELREYILSLFSTENLTNVSIRYQRGFINNCSHAFDIIEYLTGKAIELTSVKKHNIIIDHFDYDPTVSLQAYWGTSNFNVMGLTHVAFSHFEIDLFFEYHKISILESGNIVNVYKAEKGHRFLNPLMKQNEPSREGCIKDYMAHVIDKANNILKGELKKDNFISSVELNQRMLNYLYI